MEKINTGFDVLITQIKRTFNEKECWEIIADSQAYMISVMLQKANQKTKQNLETNKKQRIVEG